MYSQLLKEYDEKASQSEQMKYAQTLLHAAELCDEQNRFLESFDMNTTGLKAAIRWGDPATQMRYLGGLGNLHSTFEDYEHSLSYFRRGYKMAVEHGNVPMQYKFLQALAIAYTTINDPQHAKEMLRKLQLIDIGDVPELKKSQKFFTNYIQGLIAERQGLPAVSRFFHREAYNAVWADSLPPSMAITEAWQMGRAYQLLHQPDSAMSWLRHSEQMSLQYGQPAHLQKIYASLAELAGAMATPLPASNSL